MASEIWKCGDCGDTHEEREQAAECCAPLPVMAWACAGCENTHDEKDDALYCCADKVRCDKCTRPYRPKSLNGVSVRVLGFCNVCTPAYSHDQQHRVEEAFYTENGRACNVLSGAVY